MEDYTYETTSKYKHLLYFKENPISTWSQDDFVKYYGGDENDTKRKKLDMSYLYCLNCVILQDENVPDEVKDYIKVNKNVSKLNKAIEQPTHFSFC